MAKCTTTNLYKSLDFCPGEPVVAGLCEELYAISKSQILAYPSLPAFAEEGVSMDTASVLKGSFTLAADAKFFRIDILDTASSLKSESQGERPSKTFLNTLSVKFPGNNEAAAGFCRLANTDNLLYILRQRDGKYRVVGNKMFSTETKPSQESGQGVTEASGTTIEITCTDFTPAPFFTGKIPTADGMLDCSTGEFSED